MILNQNRISNIFLLFWAVILTSDFILLYDSEVISINWVHIRIVYLIFDLLILLVYLKNTSYKTKLFTLNNFFMVILLIHTTLFGLFLTNPLMEKYIKSYFVSQLMFLLIVFTTSTIIIKLGLFEKFIKISFFTISLYLFIHFILNFNDIDLNNVFNIFSVNLRTVTSLGFSHHNTLGNICVCDIILWIFFKKCKPNSYENAIAAFILIMCIVMLLCSASRTSLTALILFLLVNAFLKLGSKKMNKKNIKIFRICIIIVIILLILGVSTIYTIGNFLEDSQRSLIFLTAIPTYLKSGRTIIGLGYASNTIYGTNLTPYLTYFIDNGYAYYLVTTGILGFLIIIFALIIIAIGISKQKTGGLKRMMICTFISYLYTVFFEAILISGIATSYVYMVLFSLFIGYEFSNYHLCALE